MKFDKSDIGNEILAYPTGNNARRGVVEQEITRFVVVDTHRKYVSLRRHGSNFVQKYSVDRGATERAVRAGFGVNAGYKFFRTEEELNEWKDLQEKERTVTRSLREINGHDLLNNPEFCYDLYEVLEKHKHIVIGV